METKKIFKTVFTLVSGKSIVVSITEKECLDAHDSWIRYIYKDTVLSDDSPLLKIPLVETISFIKRDSDGKLIEISTIKISEISAIQILQNINL